MFNLRNVLALLTSPRTPYDAALRDLAHGKPAEALDALDRLLALETDTQQRAAIANKRGVALVALEQRDRARIAFEDAVGISPEFAPALVNLGNLEFESERFEAAAAFYERALQSDRELASAHRHLGLVYRRMGRQSEAMRLLSRARRLEGRANTKPRK